MENGRKELILDSIKADVAGCVVRRKVVVGRTCDGASIFPSYLGAYGRLPGEEHGESAHSSAVADTASRFGRRLGFRSQMVVHAFRLRQHKFKFAPQIDRIRRCAQTFRTFEC